MAENLWLSSNARRPPRRRRKALRKQISIKALVGLSMATILAVGAFAPTASALTRSGSRSEYNRTRVISISTSLADSYSCLACVNVTQKWIDGHAKISTAAGPYPKPASATPKTSRINPKASASGLSLDASLGTSGLGVGATAGGGSCNAGTYSASGSTVSVDMWGTWCRVSGLSIWGVTISATGGTQYGTNWSSFSI